MPQQHRCEAKERGWLGLHAVACLTYVCRYQGLSGDVTCIGLARKYMYIYVYTAYTAYKCRVGQNPFVHTVYTWYLWQGKHQICVHIRCVYTIMANPSDAVYAPVIVEGALLSCSASVRVWGVFSPLAVQCTGWGCR